MTSAAPSRHNPVLHFPDLHLQLLQAAVPERAAELLELLKAANVQVVQASDKPGFKLETAFGAIVVGHRTPAASWIVTLAAWTCVAAYYPALLLMSGRLASAEIANMPGQAEHVATTFRYLTAARNLLIASDVNAFAWPTEVPQPVLHPASPPDQLVRDIAHIAWAFMLLHEIKHTELEASGTRPADPLEEERMCDAFAIDFLMDQTDHYAAEFGKPAELVRDLPRHGCHDGAFPHCRPRGRGHFPSSSGAGAFRSFVAAYGRNTRQVVRSLYGRSHLGGLGCAQERVRHRQFRAGSRRAVRPIGSAVISAV